MLRTTRRTLERLDPRHLLAADASLSGMVWFDANEDAVWDVDEVGLATVQVYLDLNGDGQLSIDEPATFTLTDDPVTTENESGYYEFTNLEPGEYEVRVVLDNDLEQTFPHAIPVMEDLMVNGSFEEGYQGWVNVPGAGGRQWSDPASAGNGATCIVGNDNEVLYGGLSPQDGEKVAWNRFNALSVATLYQLYQDIDLTTVPTSTLQFQYRVEWNHTCAPFTNAPTIPNTFSVQIRDVQTDQVLHETELAAMTADEAVGDTTWQEFNLPLHDFFGRSVRVAFVADVQSLNVQFNRIQLDGVSVLAPTSTEIVGSHTVVVGPGQTQAALDFGLYSSQPLNSAPVLSGPELLAMAEDDSLTWTSLLGLADIDAADQDLQVALSVDVGELALEANEGVTVVSGTASGDNQLWLQGSLTALNAALDNLTFTPPDDFHGTATLNIIASDLGHQGLGGAKSDELAVPIQVNPVNDPPQVDVPLDNVVLQEGTESQTLDVSHLFTDIDVGTSGDVLTIEVTANSNTDLVTTSWAEGELVLDRTPGLSGVATITLTATDGDGASAEYSFDVTVLATSRISLNLARLEQLADVGQPSSDGGGSAGIFHEWEDAAAELWITIQSDLPSGPFDISWTAESAVSWVNEAVLIDHVGSTSSVTAVAHENGTRFSGQIAGVDLTGFQIGDHVLLATLLLPQNLEDVVGVPHSVEGAYAMPTPESGLTLTEANIPATQQALAVDENVPGHFLPVIFDANDDGSVRLSDFAQFVGSFGLAADAETPRAFRFDYDRNGSVGLSDFAMFVRSFGARKDSEHGITVSELLGQESPQTTRMLEGEPVEMQPVAPEVAASGVDTTLVSTWFTEPRKSAVSVEGKKTPLLEATDLPVPVLSSGSSDPAVLDALWRDESWGFGVEEKLDDGEAAVESLEPEFSDWSEI